MTATANAEQVRARFEEHGQGHVFAFWEKLNEEQRAALLDDCRQVDFDWLAARREQTASGQPIGSSSKIEPAPILRLPSSDLERAREDEARGVGEQALREGKLAAFLVAGGQGTRLGYDGPKGCYAVGPVTERTLFQWHADQIRALARRHGVVIPWYIMTSRTNHAATVQYFKENDYLGFDAGDVMFFQQAMVPSVGFDGKLILQDECHLAMNPDGHGGSLTALVRSGAIADMKKRGITTISYFQVDNPLVTICDPVFVGYHLQANAQMSSKILDKAYPEEKVGHICLQDGRTTVIEYSDMSDEDMHACDASGKLVFWAGSIAIHMLDVAFVEQVGGKAQLPWHEARKKIPHVDAQGKPVEPKEPNGIKYETFVFDALPLTASSITMEVAREEEFAPVKNKSGVDSAESCQKLLSNRFARWLKAAGVAVPCDKNGDAAVMIEISPLYALDADELKSKIKPGLEVGSKLVLA